MASTIRLLTAIEEAQLRRLEPRLYHLVLTASPGPQLERWLRDAADADAEREPYALVIEPLVGLRGLLRASTLRLPRALHVAVVARSPSAMGVAHLVGALGRLVHGPRTAAYESLEAAFGASQRALALASAHAPRAPHEAPRVEPREPAAPEPRVIELYAA
jgi:hypothetical protein